MVGSSRRRTLRRRRADAAAARRPPQPALDDVRINIVDHLPPELLAEIHSHLGDGDADFLKRLAFASVCGASGHLLKPEAPCLILAGAAGGAEEEAKASVFSLAAGRAAAVRAPDPAMRGHVVVGSSGGWLVTADARGTLRMANPVTGAQGDLPAITTGRAPSPSSPAPAAGASASTFTPSVGSDPAARPRRRRSTAATAGAASRRGRIR
ncbi:unnamed protein product [Urochloa humidicola]